MDGIKTSGEFIGGVPEPRQPYALPPTEMPDYAVVRMAKSTARIVGSGERISEILQDPTLSNEQVYEILKELASTTIQLYQDLEDHNVA